MSEDKTYSISHRYDADSNILVRAILGVMNIQDIVDSWNKDIQNGIVHERLKGVVTDFTKGENNASLADLKDLENFYNENLRILQSVKMAVVLNAPTVSVSLFFEKNNHDLIHKSFASIDAALEWTKE